MPAPSRFILPQPKRALQSKSPAVATVYHDRVTTPRQEIPMREPAATSASPEADRYADSMHCQDVMQVCRNGHVVTELLRAYPDRGLSHCDRCGAATLDHCQTCGQELPGAVHVPGLVPVGCLEPPLYCSHCGAAFPWAISAPAPAAEAWPLLECLL